MSKDLLEKFVDQMAELEKTAQILSVIEGDPEFLLFTQFMRVGATSLAVGDLEDIMVAIMPVLEAKVNRKGFVTEDIAVDPRFSPSKN